MLRRVQRFVRLCAGRSGDSVVFEFIFDITY